MFIKNIDIGVFGGVKNLHLDFDDHVNIIEGENEAGKSTICAFIKFIFYGLSGKSTSGEMSERKRYLPFEGGGVYGSLTLRAGTPAADYRIERRITPTGKTAAKDEYQIISLETGAPAFEGAEPCDAFLSMSEGLFARTVFVSQKMGAQLDGGSGGKEIAAALENLLFSAEETVDSAKALRALDSARAELLHKNAKGGRLYEACAQRDELIARLEKAKTERQALAKEEQQLIQLKKSEAGNSKLTKEAKAKIEQYESASLLLSFAKLRTLAQKGDALQKKKDQITPAAGVPETEEIHTAIRLSAALRSTSEQAEKLKEELQTAAPTGHDAPTGALQQSPDELYKLQKTSRALKAAGLFLLAAGMIAGGLAAVGWLTQRFLAGGLLPVLGALCAAFMLAGSVLLGVGMERGSRLRKALAACGAANLEAFAALADEQAERARAQARHADERQQKESALQDKLYYLRSLQAQAEELCGKYGAGYVSPDSLDTLAVRLTAIKENCYSLEQEMKQNERAQDELRRLLSDYEEEQLRSQLPDPPEVILKSYNIKDLKNRLVFGTASEENIRNKRSELEKDVVAKRAVIEDVEKLQAEIEELSAEIGALQLRYDAIRLAYDKIEEAAQRMKNNVSPALAKRAGELMCQATGGKYARLWVADDISLTYETPGTGSMIKEADFLSRGTKDLAYIALRIALCETLCQDPQMPMVFDETFCALDNRRFQQMMAVIAQRQGQTLIFTSQTREKELTEKAHMILL